MTDGVRDAQASIVVNQRATGEADAVRREQNTIGTNPIAGRP